MLGYFYGNLYSLVCPLVAFQKSVYVEIYLELAGGGHSIHLYLQMAN